MNNTLKYYRSKRDNLQLRYGNRLYNLRARKQNEFVCCTDKCYASLFLVLILVGGQHVIAEPLELLSYNDSHKEHCIEKPDEFFETREQRTKVNGELGPFSKIQQTWERNRAEFKENNPESTVILPDFSMVLFINNFLFIYTV